MSGLKIVSGMQQRKQAKRLAAANVRPEYEGAEAYEQMVDIFTSQAQYGIDPRTRQWAEQANANAMNAGLQTVLQSGGDPNAAAQVYQNYGNALNELAAADSDRRFQKVNALAGIMDKSLGASRDEFLYNKDAPFKDTAQLAAAKQAAGYNEILSGLDSAFSSIINNESAKIYGDKGGGGAPVTSGSKSGSGAYVPNQADWEGWTRR